MRTQEEIAARIRERQHDDAFGFEQNDLLAALDFAHAEPFLKPGTTAEEWDAAGPPLTVDAVRQAAVNYLAFAFRKAQDERGISAIRSMSHYAAWLWLLGVDDFDPAWDGDDYGLTKLRDEVCPALGVDPPTQAQIDGAL